MNTTVDKIEGTTEAWESGILGKDEKYARLSKSVSDEDVDKAAGLQMISIRLEKELLETLKSIADLEGMGYQPLIRRVLNRFATAEAKRILRHVVASDLEKEAAEGDAAGVNRNCA